MKKLEKEYTAMKTKEQEELVELKVDINCNETVNTYYCVGL